MTNDPSSAFAKRLPLLQLFSDEQKTTLSLAVTAFGQGLDHFNKMLALAAGLAGFAVPLIATTRSSVVNGWFLRRAAVSFSFAVGVGVVEIVVGRWLFVYMVRLTRNHYNAVFKALGAAGDDDTEIAKALAVAEQSGAIVQTKLGRLQWLVLVGDVLFYGLLLFGIADVVRAVTVLYMG